MFIISYQIAGFAEDIKTKVEGNNLNTPSEQPAPTASQSDKLNVDNLEKKYWSSKDDNFTVVQNRTFTKVQKYFLSLRTGKLINDGYSEGVPTALSAGYFWSERWGMELDSQTFSLKDNAITKGFNSFGVYPNYNKPKSSKSLGVVFVPIYAKVSLFEQKILYLDLAFGLNFGTAQYTIETDKGQILKSTGQFGFDITQNWFISKDFALRFDIRNKWSSQDQMKYQISSTASENSRALGRSQFLDTTWQFGFTYFH
jgi:hypothetical protein